MISRRYFLQATAVSTAALSSIATAEESSIDCKPLPPAIAKLSSLKDQAQSITAQERGDRQEKARRLMRTNGIDAVLLMSGTSLEYFSGIKWWPSERTFAMVLPMNGKPFFVCPAFEQARAIEQLANSPQEKNADIRIWQEDESPYQKLAQGLHDLGIATGTLGIEETVRFVFSNAVSQAAPQNIMVSATAVTAGCRMIKSPHEIALMRLACKATLAVYEAVFKSLREGMTDSDIRGLVRSA
jgi:Xaa-Pro dipeptidase